MASPIVESPGPTLLGLPLELRRQILRYAYIATCSPAPLLASKIPNGIKLRWASDFQHALLSAPSPEVHGFWGREAMSRILRVNHQLYTEAVEVLYGDFVFEFVNTTRLEDVRFWLDLLGDKKKLVKHIGVAVVVDLKVLSLVDDLVSRAAKNGMKFKSEAWGCLRRELEGLKSVRIEFAFVRMLRGGWPGRENLIEELLRLLRIFEGLDIMLIDGPWMNEERASILETCYERMGKRI
jgi:hypothetical protein